jgi:hypothetical protein
MPGHFTTSYLSADSSSAIAASGDEFFVGEVVGHQGTSDLATIKSFKANSETNDIDVDTDKGHCTINFLVKVDRAVCVHEGNNCTLSKTKEWFEKAVPNPVLKNFNSQLGCHFEEVAEMLNPIQGVDSLTSELLISAEDAMSALASHIKNNSGKRIVFIESENELEFLDAICDQIVTGTGVAHMSGQDIIGAMTEVNDSNFSKFEDGLPLFDANRKIIKGKHYRKANLEPFLKK